MKKIIIILLVFATTFQVKADEGMWLPMLIQRLNYVDMQKCGLQLTAEEIYSVNNSSLKDAVVALGGGFCTGEIISNQGLMLTNHHCGFGAIQENSTTEHDYLTDGFWAMTKEQEIPVDFSVWFLDRMDDVTSIILKDVTKEMTEEERTATIRKAIKELSGKEMEGKTEDNYKVQIKSFYYGNEYYMFKYNIFNDVRMVGAPPSSIGKFGGDTDNWMWPRHTGDFSMFRIYADKDNNPAAYAKDNKPYQPKHHLPVSLEGVSEGDYAMVMGYPGSTDRYLTSFGVKEAVNVDQPARVMIRRTKLDIMDVGMEKDQKVRIQYASKYARTSNYWKYFQGQSHQLVKNKVQDKKEEIEKKFSIWANANEERKATYGNALQLIEEAYKNTAKYTLPNVYFQEAVFQGPDIFGLVMGDFAFRSEMQAAITANDKQKIEDAKKSILEDLPAIFKDYNAEIDEHLLAEMLHLFYTNLDAEFHPATLTSIAKKYKKDFKKFAADYMSKSPFSSQDKLTVFLNKFSVKTLQKDPIYNLMNELIDIYIQRIVTPQRAADENMNKGMRLFVDGLKQMNADKIYASDANSTMRVTYGNILSYKPADAVNYNFVTTLEGVMEKEVKTNNKNHEFYIPAKLKELYEKKDYGQYATKEGKLPVGFISNNDITGGNSGSPVINAKGHLIGTAFDGNWEAMSGDIYFEPNIQRTISVDIRYTLFIIDKYAGAKHLIDEMTLIK
ncbi:MAG: serine protease [Flavobacteriales bacterium CG_4_9_14_0_2_um_filter_32_27]|nr:MAG: serine protease [Flavobacteriales bacterium CG_4_9_14_0_2_um_filter_32_27]